MQIEIVVPLTSVRDAASVAATTTSLPTCGGETGVGISQATDAPSGSMSRRTNRHPPPVLLVDGSRNANEAFPSTEKRKRVLLKTCLLCYVREKLWHNNQRQVGAGRPPARHQVVSGVTPSKSCRSGLSFWSLRIANHPGLAAILVPDSNTMEDRTRATFVA